MAIHRQEPFAFFAARIGAVEDVVVLRVQMRRPFERHGPADMIVGRVDIGAGETQMPQQIEGRIVQLGHRNTKRAGAELLPQCPLVEHEPNIESRGQRRFDLFDLGRTKAVADQRGCG